MLWQEIQLRIFCLIHALNFHSQFDKSSNSFVTLGCFGYGPMQDKKTRQYECMDEKDYRKNFGKMQNGDYRILEFVQ